VVEDRENTMRSKEYLTIIITLIATLGLIGLVETVGAAKPDKPPGKDKGPRGLEGSTFLVEVWNPTTGTFVFKNCYHFSEGGVWYDDYFGLQGTWALESKGSKGPKGIRNSYTAETGGPTDTDEFGSHTDLQLDQSGNVLLAGGILQLSADLTLTFYGPPVVYDLVLFGWENADCELD
jgi:hypothetical protein